MHSFFIATSNPGKQKEIVKYAHAYGKDVSVFFPTKANEIAVEESGTTFEENALLKAKAYKDLLGGTTEQTVYVGDDSGISIAALDGEPGVFTRRWNGSEMTDQEILDYCMKKMLGLTGDERKAVFETVLAVIRPDETVKYIHGVMRGHILTQPLKNVEPQAGFPFRSIFWVDALDVPIYKIHELTPQERSGFLTHREDAFKRLFESYDRSQTES